MDIKLYRKYDELYYNPECTEDKKVKFIISHGTKTFSFIDSNGYQRYIALDKFKKLEHNGMVSFAPKSGAPASTNTVKKSTPVKTQSDDAKKFLDKDEFALYEDLMKKIQDRRASYDIRKKSYDDIMNSLKILGISGDAARPFLDNYIKTVGPIDPDWITEDSDDSEDSDD